MRIQPIVVAICLALSSHGCVAKLTPAGAEVNRARDLAFVAQNCEFLGEVMATEDGAWGHNLKDREGALNRIRNQVAQMGGDVFLITDESSGGFAWHFVADAFNCEGAERIAVGDSSEIQRGVLSR